MKLAVYSMGGTIDKVYFDDLSDYTVGEPQVGAILTQAGVDFDFTVTEVARKDSLYVTGAEREELRRLIAADPCPRVLVTHGTDTMTETASVLASLSGKTIVLTGAMSPARFAASDAAFNVGCAVGAVWSQPPGVYIAMSGRLFAAGAVRKNRDRGRFEALYGNGEDGGDAAGKESAK